MINEIENTIKAALTALKNGDVDELFRTVEVWDNQLTGAGKNSFERFAPFAFIKYIGANYENLGDMDLSRQLEFGVTIGSSGPAARSDVLARIAAVTSAIHDAHPNELDDSAEPIACDRLYASEEIEIVHTPKQYAMSIVFTCKAVE
jgi:hypothetical protein